MSYLVTETMRRTYAAQRGVSQGAHITLTSTALGYQARFECAKRAATVLGDRYLEEYGRNGESIPLLTIPLEEMHRAITKLAESYSVALVDTVTDERGSRFVLVWRIAPTKALLHPEVVEAIEKKETDRLLVLAGNNQGADPLDEY